MCYHGMVTSHEKDEGYAFSIQQKLNIILTREVNAVYVMKKNASN